MQADPLRNKRLLEAAFKFWAENVIPDDFDDCIRSFAADELTSMRCTNLGIVIGRKEQENYSTITFLLLRPTTTLLRRQAFADREILLWSEVLLPARCFFLVVGHCGSLHFWLCWESFGHFPPIRIRRNLHQRCKLSTSFAPGFYATGSCCGAKLIISTKVVQN